MADTRFSFFFHRVATTPLPNRQIHQCKAVSGITTHFEQIWVRSIIFKLDTVPDLRTIYLV